MEFVLNWNYYTFGISAIYVNNAGEIQLRYRFDFVIIIPRACIARIYVRSLSKLYL